MGIKDRAVSIFLNLVCSFLLPESINVTRLENLLLPFIFIAIIGVDTFKSNKPIIYTLLALFFASVLSNVVNFKGLESYVNSIRFIKYIFLFLITGHLIIKQKNVFYTIIDLLVICLIVINLIQIFNPFDWGYELLKIYSNHSQNYELNRVFNRNFRLFGTQNNPNNNAIIWGMVSFYYYVKNIEKNSIWNYVVIFFSLIFLFLTQSRTSLVGLVFSFTVYYFIKNFSIKTTATLFGGGIFGIILLKFSGLSYMQQLLTTNPLEIHSFQLRFQTWSALIDLWMKQPLFGLGLETNYVEIIGQAPDNEFLFFIASGGVLFIIPYLFLFVTLLIVGFKNLKSKNPFYGLYVLLPLFLLLNSITNY